MARRGASGRRKGEEDGDRRGCSLEIRKGEQLFQCRRVTGRRLSISTIDQVDGFNACVSEDLQ